MLFHSTMPLAEIHRRKKNVLGILVDAVDYDTAVERVVRAARGGRPLAVSALAVHGVMTGVFDPEHRHRLNSFDLLVPDGQPVRWALNSLHRAGLTDRVYGPQLTLELCARAAREGIPIFLYGSRPEVLASMIANLERRFPGLRIAGSHPSRFRALTSGEKAETVAAIRASGARLVFVGLGCPRQEMWVYEFHRELEMPVLAVGAAFDFIAGNLPQAPPALQRRGLEWLYRLVQEPRRLWRRYLVWNPIYLGLFFLQWTRLHTRDPFATREPRQETLPG